MTRDQAFQNYVRDLEARAQWADESRWRHFVAYYLLGILCGIAIGGAW